MKPGNLRWAIDIPHWKLLTAVIRRQEHSTKDYPMGTDLLLGNLRPRTAPRDSGSTEPLDGVQGSAHVTSHGTVALDPIVKVKASKQ